MLHTIFPLQFLENTLLFCETHALPLTLGRPMTFFKKKLNTVKSGCPLYTRVSRDHMFYIVFLFFLNNIVFLSLKVDFVLANSADPAKCHIQWHFIWFHTVCKSIHLGFSGLQRFK